VLVKSRGGENRHKYIFETDVMKGINISGTLKGSFPQRAQADPHQKYEKGNKEKYIQEKIICNHITRSKICKNTRYHNRV
jgi:hypothetical protein